MQTVRRALLGLALTASLAVVPPTVAAHAGDAPRAIDAIENDLVADDPAVRAKAAAELTDRFPDGAVAVPMLVDLLDDEDPAVVAAAAKAIDSMAIAGAKPLVAVLVDASNWSPSSHMLEQVAGLLRTGSPNPEYVIHARSTAFAPSVEQLTIAALCRPRDFDKTATPLLLSAYRSGSGEARPLAAAALAMHGGDALWAARLTPESEADRTSPAKEMLRLVESDLDVESWAGCRVLLRLRCSDPSVVKALTRAVGAKKAVRIPEGFQPDDRRAPAAAIDALGALGPAGDSSTESLLTLAAKDASVARASVRALVRMRKETELFAMLGTNPPTLDRIEYALADERLALTTLVPRLVERLKASTRQDGLEELALCGSAAAPALPVIRERMRSPSEANMVLTWAQALIAIAPGDDDAMKVFDSVLDGTDRTDARCALVELADHASPDPRVAGRLIAAAEQEVAEEKVARVSPPLVLGLGRCAGCAGAAVPTLLKCLFVAEYRCRDLSQIQEAALDRRRLVMTLGLVGPGAATASAPLESMRANGDETIRVAAAQALRRIRAKK
jgi:hypothetical protein